VEEDAQSLTVAVGIIAGAYDIDTIGDLRPLERDLIQLPASVAPNVRRWLLTGRS
jgi:hypothetical protein